MTTCPVCDSEMKEMETPNLIACDKVMVKIPELNLEVESTHATYYLNQDNSAVIKIIEILPYIFHIHDDPKSIRQTRISKIVKTDYRSDRRVSVVKFGGQRLHCEQLIIVPGVVNIQWNNFDLVKERVKMYTLFS